MFTALYSADKTIKHYDKIQVTMTFTYYFMAFKSSDSLIHPKIFNLANLLMFTPSLQIMQKCFFNKHLKKYNSKFNGLIKYRHRLTNNQIIILSILYIE